MPEQISALLTLLDPLQGLILATAGLALSSVALVSRHKLVTIGAIASFAAGAFGFACFIHGAIVQPPI